MLYQKVRPDSLSKVVGNKQVVKSLQAVLSKKDHPHVFMLTGESGCGKTTIARILAKELGCEGITLCEINAANTRGVDTVRSITESAGVAPLFGEAKGFIFDESQQLTKAAQECLLKVIEDCPEHVYFFFCTTDPQKIIKTIKNRCAQYRVSPLRRSEMTELLSDIIQAEGLKTLDNEDIIDAIAKAANGCPRQGIMMLEQVQDVDDVAEALEVIATTEVGSKEVYDLIKEVVSKRANRWATTAKLYKGLTTDPESIRLPLLGYCKKILLNEADITKGIRMAELIAILEKPTYGGGDASLVRMLFEACLVD